jgi:hypothetical protein
MKTMDISLTRGSTNALTILWEVPPIKYVPITSITQTAPVRITAESHGIPDGWRAVVVSAGGMREINAPNPAKIRDEDYHQVTVIDANTIEFNDVNAAGFRAYTAGGYLQYNTPKDLTGFSARMSVRSKRGVENLLVCTAAGTSGAVKPTGSGVDGAVTWEVATAGTPYAEWKTGHDYEVGDVIDLEEIIRLSSDNGRIVIDEALYTITRVFSATDTELFAKRAGVYDLEMVSPDTVPVVTKLQAGSVAIEKEATTR